MEERVSLHEVLDCCSDTARLHATYIRGGDMAREVRVFGEALKALQGGEPFSHAIVRRQDLHVRPMDSELFD